MKSLLLATAICLAATSANAALVTWRVTGVITAADDDDGLLPVPSVGETTMSVDYTFEDSTPDLENDPNQGMYFNALRNVNLTVGAYSASFVPALSGNTFANLISIQNDRFIGGSNTIDQFGVYGARMPQPPSNGIQTEFAMTWNAHSAFLLDPLSSDSTPSTPPDPLFFSLPAFFWTVDEYSDGALVARDSVRAFAFSHSIISPVPLPAAAWLLLSGVGALGGFAHRRRAVAA
jgi:hypothetical protein